MLCKTTKHRLECACQNLRNIYGSSIYKCDRPGCPAFRTGFDTRSKRDGHKQRHTRPFKCQNSECPFADLGFATKTSLESHLAKNHGQSLHIVPAAALGQASASSEEELQAILIDAVRENDLSTIRSEASAVRKHILDLLLSAYQGRSSDAMIQHLFGEIPPDFKISSMPENRYRELALCNEILRASIEYRGDNMFRMSSQLLITWFEASGHEKETVLILMGRARRADLLEMVVSTLRKSIPSFVGHGFEKELFVSVIPGQPDKLAETLALECLERIKPYVSRHSDRLLLAVAGGCCSVAIAEFLCAQGAQVDCVFGGSRPILSAAKQTSLEAAKFMEFLLKKGAKPMGEFKGKNLSDLPGPRNIHKWIGITWEELVEAQGSVQRS